MKKSLAVIALGGNALTKPSDTGDYKELLHNVNKTAKLLVKVMSHYAMVIVPGSGPQVGNVVLQNELSKRVVPSMPLDVLDAEVEGWLGYLLESSLQRVKKQKVTSIITQTLVSAHDPAFHRPSKPIGPFYSQVQARALRMKGIPVVADAGRGFRRVVPSPLPLAFVEIAAIRNLLKKGWVVIAAVGGGIPVVKSAAGFRGVEAVVDKDFAAACLASSLHADYLFILTGVDAVYQDFNAKKQKRLSRLSVLDAEMLYAQGHFPSGSMGPKILAACQFLRKGGKRVIITSPEKLSLALLGKAGTIIEGLV
ncbi:MAG: carbamate kinase [Nanoarchaeota archaeon]|nr:carbamate kinase [Nanoarchaeota archaeon]